VTPAEIAATKAAEMLDQAAEHVKDPAYVANCVAIADGWTRLHGALAATAFMSDGR
jgi:hypothetical protein